MTETGKKRGKLSVEIVLILTVCFLISLFLYVTLSYFGSVFVEEYVFYNDIQLDEFQFIKLDNTVFTASLLVSVLFFLTLFFAFFGKRISYIRTIIGGVDELQKGNYGHKVEIKGNNELTSLAERVNFLSETERKIKEKEKALSVEKEELIRSLSHDIRTPLTSVMSYTELLSSKDVLTAEEKKEYFDLVQRKTAQIKELTEILLEGGKSDPEYFERARLLMVQFADEFEAELENEFSVSADLRDLSEFSGSFNVGDLHRIFDNLITNVRKYADEREAVKLSVSNVGGAVVIKQTNRVKKTSGAAESRKIGINSMRRIAHSYGGSVKTSESGGEFEILITLSEF